VTNWVELITAIGLAAVDVRKWTTQGSTARTGNGTLVARDGEVGVSRCAKRQTRRTDLGIETQDRE